MSWLNRDNRGSNLFTSFLDELDVPYTQKYSNKMFNEHPYRNTMYGISKMLRDYNIANTGYLIQDKTSFTTQIEPPFIAHVSDEFLVFYQKEENSFGCWRDGKSIKIPFNIFVKIWSGAVLVAEPTECSIEPDYQKHRRLDSIIAIEKFTLILLFSILTVNLLITYSSGYINSVLLPLLVNLVGTYIAYLIIKKENHVHSRFSDQVCSLFKKSDCNNILESSASKFLGIISWSEIGMGYFISNLLLIVLYPKFIFYYSIINILILPYSFWSVWYQRYRAKTWCPLCLVILLLLWCLFFVNVFNDLVFIQEIYMQDIACVFCIYSLPTLTLYLLLPNLVGGSKDADTLQQLNSVRLKDEVFHAIMKEQPYHDINDSDSHVLFGNTSSKNIITIFTNPHCNPCSLMHNRVKKVLDANKNMCVQYVFSSFNESLDSSCLFLIAVYLQAEENECIRIYDEWFIGGKNNKDSFMAKYNQFTISEDVSCEYLQHVNWKKKNKIGVTPKVLINGFELPDIYKIEDMQYFATN